MESGCKTLVNEHRSIPFVAAQIFLAWLWHPLRACVVLLLVTRLRLLHATCPRNSSVDLPGLGRVEWNALTNEDRKFLEAKDVPSDLNVVRSTNEVLHGPARHLPNSNYFEGMITRRLYIVK